MARKINIPKYELPPNLVTQDISPYDFTTETINPWQEEGFKPSPLANQELELERPLVDLEDLIPVPGTKRLTALGRGALKYLKSPKEILKTAEIAARPIVRGLRSKALKPYFPRTFTLTKSQDISTESPVDYANSVYRWATQHSKKYKIPRSERTYHGALTGAVELDRFQNPFKLGFDKESMQQYLEQKSGDLKISGPNEMLWGRLRGFGYNSPKGVYYPMPHEGPNKYGIGIDPSQHNYPGLEIEDLYGTARHEIGHREDVLKGFLNAGRYPEHSIRNKKDIERIVKTAPWEMTASRYGMEFSPRTKLDILSPQLAVYINNRIPEGKDLVGKLISRQPLTPEEHIRASQYFTEFENNISKIARSPTRRDEYYGITSPWHHAEYSNFNLNYPQIELAKEAWKRGLDIHPLIERKYAHIFKDLKKPPPRMTPGITFDTSKSRSPFSIFYKKELKNYKSPWYLFPPASIATKQVLPNEPVRTEEEENPNWIYYLKNALEQSDTAKQK